ncbi:hypothetical protein [uncultured Tenacibaculum sp.]|uniref:hypothetical protein n=1 Tax=uncultured Tenacibaculum sp. TaxID=174713 RepID=UPI002602DEE9|nr:hypothetical protein [uncultured Tenacibaculum sp.]
MSFLKSAVNQVGRDLGKVVSNQLFNDNHSTPYRRAINNKSVRTPYKTDFDKAINFQTGHKPNTLIIKLSGLYTTIKNEANGFISDGYLDTSESNKLFNMITQFNNKVDDVCDILEIDEQSNKKEINQLTTLVNKVNNLFNETLKISANGCLHRQNEHKEAANSVENISFSKYLGLNLIWLGGYSRGGKKSITNAIIANLADLTTLTFPLTRTYLFIKGIFTYSKENNRRIKVKEALLKLAELEGKRAETYLSIGNKKLN